MTPEQIKSYNVAIYLAEKLKGATVTGVFAKSKQELIFNFYTTSGVFHLQTWFGQECFIFFPEEVEEANLYPTFSSTKKNKIAAVFPHRDDRSFSIHFTNKTVLVFKMYGRNGNVILLDEESGKEPQLFRKHLLKDLEVNITSFQPVQPPYATIPKDFVDGLNNYAEDFLRLHYFTEKKQELLLRLITENKKIEKRLSSSKIHLSKIESATNFKEQADIIMANLHSIPKGITEVSLFNFYKNEDETIVFKKGISPQKWAEKLYLKSRNQQKETIHTKEQLEKGIKELEENISLLEQVRKANDLRELKASIPKALYKSAEKTSLSQDSKLKTQNFKLFSFLGYEILAGKNSKDNDELTFRIAKKDDLWLHARDVSGSHVIVRKKHNQNIPKFVIEMAASVAAWFSKSKDSTLVPVIYTQKKNVRKPKGAKAGAVIAERQELIIVPPKLPNELQITSN